MTTLRRAHEVAPRAVDVAEASRKAAPLVPAFPALGREPHRLVEVALRARDIAAIARVKASSALDQSRAPTHATPAPTEHAAPSGWAIDSHAHMDADAS